MQLFYTDHFELPLPAGHRFPMSKYRLLRQTVVESSFHETDVLLVPPAATDEQLFLAHCENYVRRVARGNLTDREIRRIGFPWSEKMVERSRRSTGATLAASRSALTHGISVNLAGGTHHAMRSAGEGYCVFNDVAVSARTLQSEGLIQTAIVIDCDVHQGNGTAEIFADDASVFTVSLHGEKNFPLRKFPSDIDINLPDQTTDDDYCEILQQTLERAFQGRSFDIAYYLAGADPFEGDRLGRLALTKPGLKRRDEIVLSFLRQLSTPVAISMAGGYANDVKDIVDIHAQTTYVASAIWKSIHA